MPEMKTKWNFRPLVALVPMGLLVACADVGPGYYGGGYGGGYGGYGSGYGGGYYGGGSWWGGGFNGWGYGGRGVCRVCGYNPCRCRHDRGDQRDDRDDRREQGRSGSSGGSGGGTAYRLKEAERDEPEGWHSRKWFEDRGYKFSRNTWENRDGRTVQGSEIRKSGGESERRKETVSEQRGGGRSSGASRGSDGGDGRSSGSSRGGGGGSERGSDRGSGGSRERSGGGKGKD